MTSPDCDFEYRLQVHFYGLGVWLMCDSAWVRRWVGEWICVFLSVELVGLGRVDWVRDLVRGWCGSGMGVGVYVE